MGENTSLSDIAAVTRGADNDGWGSGWFLIVVLFLFMFGFGSNGWNRQGEFGQYATAASQQENLGYEMQGNIGQLGKEMALSQNGTNMTIMQTGNGIQAQLSECCCNTQRAIDGVNANIEAKFAALEKSQLEQRIAEQSARIASLEMDNRMYGVVRYPNGYTYNAGMSPFCGGGCGCGNV